MSFCKHATLSVMFWLLLLGFASVSIAASATQQELSIAMETPDGYVEITPEDYPEYTWAVANEIDSSKAFLFHRIFLAQEELPFLQLGAFDRITSSILLLEAVDSAYTIKKGEWPDLSKEAFLRISELDVTSIAAWLKKDVAARKSLRFGPFGVGKNYAVFAHAASISFNMGFGLYPIRDQAHARIVLYENYKTFVLVFSKAIKTPDDVKNVIVMALNYMQDGKRKFLKTAKQALYDNDKLYSLPLYVAKRYEQQKELDSAESIYKRMYDFWKKEKKGANNYSARAVLELVGIYAHQNKFAKAEKLLIQNIAETKKANPPGNNSSMLMDTELGLFYRHTKNYEKSIQCFENALSQCLQGNCIKEELGRIEKHLFVSTVLAKQLKRSYELFADVFIRLLEHHDEDTISLLTYISEMYVGLPQINTAIFFNKIGLGGAVIDARKSPDDVVGRDGTGLVLINYLEEKTNRSDEVRLLSTVLAPSFDPDATLFTAARTLMVGAEVPLYAQFGEVATALAKAGKSGTETEKQAARDNFRAWLQLVEKTLDTNP